MEKFSDFADPNDGPLQGEKVKIKDMLGKKLIFTNFSIKDSKFSKNKSGKYLTIQFKEAEEADELFVIFTGSDVLIDQFQKYKDHLPFQAKLGNTEKYYTLI